jgi:site-specific recombinase XerD
MKRKYAHLLRDKDVERWFENTGRGSRITANVYLRRLGRFCEGHGTTPKKLAKMSDKQLYDLLLDLVTEMEKRGYAGSYIVSVLKAIKSWLAFNGKELRRKVKIKDAQDTPSLADERIPTIRELKKIFLSGDLKTRVACVLVAHSGLRIGSLGNYQGNDGLRIGDIPEVRIEDGEIEFERTPALIVVRKALSKSRHQYLTFLSNEGCEYLKDYLKARMRKGEKLTKKSAIIVPKTAKKPFIRAINVGDTIRNAIRKAGLPWRPYVLRSYFDTQLMIAESKGLVLRDYRQFWMGHKGDIEHRYTLNKQKLPPKVIENMRESYQKSQRYLQTTEMGEDKEDIKRMFKKQLMLVAGFKPEEITDEDLGMSDEEFQELVRDKMVGGGRNNGIRQRLVHVNEMEPYLQEGWEFVATLPNNKVVLKHAIGF